MTLKRYMLFCCAITALAATGIWAGTQDRNYDATNEEHFSSDLAGIERVSLANVSGMMKLEVGSGDTIEVVMREYANDGKSFSAQSLLDMINLKAERHGNKLEIKADYDAFRDKGMDGGDYKSDFTVLLPRRLAVQVSTVSGDVTIPDIIGAVSASTVSGDIEIAGSEGEVSASTVSGDIKIQNVKEEMAASTVSGDIFLRTGGELRGDLSLSTVNGDINLNMPMSGDFRIEAETHSGRIGGDALELRSNRRLHSMRKTFGSGRYDVNLSTVNGEITFNR